MSTYTYETVDGQKTGYVAGHGVIVDGKITTDRPIENPNFKLVGGSAAQNAAVPPAPVVGTASQQNPSQPATAEPQQPTNAGVQLG